MIPYGKQTIQKSDIAAVLQVLKSDNLTTGPKIIEFEKKLAAYCGSEYAVACSNGTAALQLAYMAAGISAGDEVITTTNTFVATVNMIVALGAKPILCDIRLDTYNIDETKIEELITKKTKAIVAVDFAGHPVDYAKIFKVAKKYNLVIIEDAAHSLGGKFNKTKCGNLGDLATFSFHPVKSITTGEGGAVMTNHKKYYEKLLSLRSHGIHKDENGFNVMTELGYNFRLTDIQAALGINQLKLLNKFIAARQNLANRYVKKMKNIDQLVLPVELSGLKSSWHLFIIRTKDKQDRLPLYNYLKSKSIGVNFHYPAIYKHPFYSKKFKKVNCPNTEIYHDSAVTLPLFPGLTLKQQDFIISSVKSYFLNK